MKNTFTWGRLRHTQTPPIRTLCWPRGSNRWSRRNTPSGPPRNSRKANPRPGEVMLYKAFISYSHAADSRLAPALESALHQLARPWYKVRALRVFRDQTNLAATPALWTTIQQALGASEYFILLASPEATGSKWVLREIQQWLGHRSPKELLLVLTQGEIVWDPAARDFDWAKTTALPRMALERVYEEEPLYVDLRWARTIDHLS